MIPYRYIQIAAVSARICVWMFVFLSAYGLVYQYRKHKEEQTALQFIIKHWFSLMKGYWFVYLCVFVGNFFAAGNTFEVYYNRPLFVFLDFMGWSDFFGTPMLSAVWWYMGFAQILIFIIPFLDAFCEKFGMAGYLIGFIFLKCLSPSGFFSLNGGGAYLYYMLSAILATVCVIYNVFDKFLDTKRMSKKWWGLLVLFVTLALLAIKYKIRLVDEWMFGSFIGGIASFFMVVMVCVLFRAKWVEQVLMFLGKHSANIFMMHMFFYVQCKQLIFWTKNPIACYFTLLGICLLLSIVMEFVKKKIHYDTLFEKMTTAMNKKISFLG